MFECSNVFYLNKVDFHVNDFYDKIGNIYRYYGIIMDKLKFNLLEVNILVGMVFKKPGEKLTIDDFNDVQLLYKKTDLSVLKKAIEETVLENNHYAISLTPEGKNITVNVNEFVNRPPTRMIDKILVSLKYTPIHDFFSVGNQLTTFSPEVIKRFQDLDGIEVFGSAYNTRLRRYGCIFPDHEKPFGSLGYAECILKGVLNKTIDFPLSKTGKGGLLISPPSPRELHDLSISYVKQILEAVQKGDLPPIEIVLAISSKKKSIFDHFEMEKFNPIQKEITHGQFFRCLGSDRYELVTVKLKENWYEFYF